MRIFGLEIAMAICDDAQDDINAFLGDLSEDQINDLLEELDPEVCWNSSVLLMFYVNLFPVG